MFIRTMDGELINSDSIIQIQGAFGLWLKAKISNGTSHYIKMVQVITLMRRMYQNSYQRRNSNNSSQILNGLDCNSWQTVKLIEKIREGGAAARDSCILR